MSGWFQPGWQDAREQAVALVKELTAMGFAVTLHTEGGHAGHPCLEVSSPPRRFEEVTEVIYTAPDDSGRWFFWWSSLERIAPAVDVLAAADKIARGPAWCPRQRAVRARPPRTPGP